MCVSSVPDGRVAMHTVSTTRPGSVPHPAKMPPRTGVSSGCLLWTMPPAPERSNVSASASGGPRMAGTPPEMAGTPPEEVKSASLLLRRVRAVDAAAIAGAVQASVDHLRPWMPWATPEAADPRAQLARVAEADELWDSGTDFIYSVLLAGSRTLIGEIGLHRRAGDGGIEIGYWVDVRHSGRGLGTEAAGALTLVALALPGVTQAEIHC